MKPGIRDTAAAFISEGRAIGAADGLEQSAAFVRKCGAAYRQQLSEQLDRMTIEQGWSTALLLKPIIDTFDKIACDLDVAASNARVRATTAGERARSLVNGIEGGDAGARGAALGRAVASRLGLKLPPGVR